MIAVSGISVYPICVPYLQSYENVMCVFVQNKIQYFYIYIYIYVYENDNVILDVTNVMILRYSWWNPSLFVGKNH